MPADDLVVEQRRVGPLANFTYLLGDPVTRTAAVVDPSFDARPVQRFAEVEGFAIEWILVTHHHPDHIADVPRLADATSARVAAHRLSDVAKDLALEDGDLVAVGEVKVRALHTPGHTPDSTCYIARSRLWTGDTLFVGECGRTDLPGGDAAQLWESFFTKLVHLPDELVVLPGHDYGPRPVSTLGEERRTNYTLQPRTKEAFVRFMATP